LVNGSAWKLEKGEKEHDVPENQVTMLGKRP